MRPSSRLVLAIASAAVTNGATATALAIDTCPPTLGKAQELSLDIVATTADVVSNKPQTLKLQHSDTTDATNFSDISGTIGGTDFTVVNADTQNPNLYKFNVDLKGKKRYVRALYSPRTTQTVTAIANLHHTSQSQSNASKANVLNLIEV